MPIFIFFALKILIFIYRLFTENIFSFNMFWCFSLIPVPPNHLHLCSSFLSFKTNRNKRNTCTLPSSRWKCKQKTNKIQKYAPAKWDEKSTKISMSLFCIGLLLLNLRACPESVIHIPRETPLEKRDFPSPIVSVADSFLAGTGEVCVYILESWGESFGGELPRSRPSAGKCLDCAWVLLKY